MPRRLTAQCDWRLRLKYLFPVRQETYSFLVQLSLESKSQFLLVYPLQIVHFPSSVGAGRALEVENRAGSGNLGILGVLSTDFQTF